MTEGKVQEIPYFVEMRGCINCDGSKVYREKHGTDYGFDHEIVAGCVLRGCVDHGVDLSRPFIDPSEVVRMLQEHREQNPNASANARKYVENVKERFGKFYEQLHISLDDLLHQLD